MAAPAPIPPAWKISLLLTTHHITFRGIQSGFGIQEDLVLFDAPSGTTLAIALKEFSDEQHALALIRQKIWQSKFLKAKEAGA